MGFGGGYLDEKLREKIIVAMERAIRVAGANDYEEGMRSARKLTEWAHEGILSIQTKEDLRSALDAVPPLTKRESNIALFLVEHLPQLIRLGLRMAAKKAASDLPPLLGGRPFAIAKHKNGEVLDYIAQLHRKGCSLEIAKDRASQKFGCSVRTVQRLWSKRESVKDEQEILEVTMDDALNYLSTED